MLLSVAVLLSDIYATDALVGDTSLTRHCHGTSPNGTNWVYLMPEHTGSLVVSSSLKKYGIHCPHGHYRLTAREVNSSAIDFVFLMVADPYKRVLSNLVYHGDIDMQAPDEERINSFRSYVCTPRNWSWYNVTNMIPSGAGRVNGLPHPMLSYFDPSIPLNYVGWTHRLKENYAAILNYLGYEDMELTDSRHCISSCRSTNAILPQSQYEGELFSYLNYYDDATADCVDRLYFQDFRVFGITHFAFRNVDFSPINTPPGRYSGARLPRSYLDLAMRTPAGAAGTDV